MRDGVRMALVLLIIGAVCGGLLAGVNAWTGPIIETRAQQEFMETLRRFFPDVDRIDEESVDGEGYFVCYDSAGNLLGVVAQAKASGYGDGPIQYNLAVDNAGNIVGIRISSHTETPGIGNFIETEEWQQQIVGLSIDDPIAVGQDIDTHSGATVTLRGITGSIRRVIDVIGAEFLGFEGETMGLDIAAVSDGTYTGTGSDVTVEVTVSGGQITEIVVLEHDYTPDYFDKAEGATIARIRDAQSIEVDAVSGATVSSLGIIEAVFNALK